MPELGRVSREEAAALAGLAPYDDDSGKQKGQRHIAGGRGRLRRSLFAAALPAAFRWNEALIRLYKRLTARGKAHNAALIACARKLLIYANTVVERGTPWTERPVTLRQLVATGYAKWPGKTVLPPQKNEAQRGRRKAHRRGGRASAPHQAAHAPCRSQSSTPSSSLASGWSSSLATSSSMCGAMPDSVKASRMSLRAR